MGERLTLLRPIRRSCKTDKETEAPKLLRHWEGNPRTTFPVVGRLAADAMLYAVIADQEAQGRRSIAHTRRHVATLKDHFEHTEGGWGYYREQTSRGPCREWS